MYPCLSLDSSTVDIGLAVQLEKIDHLVADLSSTL